MLKAITVLLFFVVTICGVIEIMGYSFCDQLTKFQSDNIQKKNTDQNDCSSPYSTFQIGHHIAGQFVHDKREEIIAVSTLIIAIFTFVLGIFTVNLASSTEELVEEACVTREQQLRAYVSITPKLVLNWRDTPCKVGISFNIKNHGQTPGTDILYDYSIAILNTPPSDLATTDGQYYQNNTIFPLEELPVRIIKGEPVTKEEVVEIEANTKRFYMWGTMRYQDAFKKPRATTFSFSFGGPDFARLIKEGTGEGWNWEYGQHHNDAT